MAEISVSIPDNQAGRAITALCAIGGYSGDPDDQKDRREFARDVVRDFVRTTVLQHEQREAAVAAMAAVVVEPITVN